MDFERGGVEIRLLDSGDLPLVQSVGRDVFDLPVRRRLAVEFLEDPRHHLVAAIQEGQIVGFTSAVHYLHPDKDPELWINEVAVAPAYRGKGIGAGILRAMLRHARTLGCRAAWVLTESDNQAAMRLYDSAGGSRGPADTVMFSFPLGPTPDLPRTNP